MALTTVRPQGMGFNTGRRNLIINGAMQVAQRGTSATVSDQSNEGYSTLDRWRTNFNNGLGGAISFSQSTDAPSGFANSLKVQCSTTDTSLSTNEYLSIHQRIEAQNLQLLGYGTSDAKAMTLSWQMKTETYTGPITVAFETADGTVEYYVKSYTPTTSWATYTCTVPASTSATINNDTGLGLYVRFALAGHSSSSIAASSDSTAWSTTRADYRSDVGNILSSTSNAIYITGVQLEVGENASDFEHRSFGEELALCQRYYETSFVGGASTTNTNNAGLVGAGGKAGDTTTSFVGHCHAGYRVNKRTTPTVTFYDLASPRNTGKCHRFQLGAQAHDNSNVTIADSGLTGFNGYSGNGGAASGLVFHYEADAEL